MKKETTTTPELPFNAKLIESAIQSLQEAVHKNSKDKGFYEGTFNVSEKLMLAVSELSEAQEADRANNYSDGRQDMLFFNDVFIRNEIKPGSELFIDYFKTNIKDTVNDELADAVIRIFDLAEALNIDLARHIIMKHVYNTTRPHKHGKKY